MLTTQEFTNRIENFLTSSGLTPTRFGREAVNDPNFVFELRKGRRPNLENVNRVLEYIRLNEAPA